MKINQLTKDDQPSGNDLLVIDSTTKGTRSIDLGTLRTLCKQFGESDNPAQANYLIHRNTFRGKYLGDHVTDEQWTMINDGTFDDIWVGDYWTINDVNWRVADINFFIKSSEDTLTGLLENHLVIFPDSCLIWPCRFAASENTVYKNSELHTTRITSALNDKIKPSFGESHVLQLPLQVVSVIGTNGLATDTGIVSSYTWTMNSLYLFGHLIPDISAAGVGLHRANFFNNPTQMSLFRIGPQKYIYGSQPYWLQDTYSTNVAITVRPSTDSVFLSTVTVSDANGLRPFFCIGGGSDED